MKTKDEIEKRIEAIDDHLSTIPAYEPIHILYTIEVETLRNVLSEEAFKPLKPLIKPH